MRSGEHALAWQCTAEMSRQVALIWWIAQATLPPDSPYRRQIAEAVAQFGDLAHMQDELMGKLAREVAS